MANSSDFGTFRRFVETPAEEMSPEMKAAYEFTGQLRGLVPGPPKIWLATKCMYVVGTPTKTNHRFI